MKKPFSPKILLVLIAFLPFLTQAQTLGGGQIHGNFQTDVQYYLKDSLIGAPNVPEKLLMNGFANVIYTNGDFNAGIRFESYQNAMLGFDPRYKGNGIPYRYASYKNENLQVTVGNFYDQFGSGMIFRTYEERNLGYDNAMDGINLKYKPYKGIELKGLIGTQRFFFDKGPGIVRGIDGDFYLNDIFGLDNMKSKFTLGGSFVSKYQPGADPVYNLPENVGAYAGRFNFTRSGFGLMGEYAYKINDPCASNGMIYKDGNGIFVSTSYSKKGIGFILSAKRIDNMDFRSDRNAVGNVLIINYLPALTKQHSYTLVAIYPYGTQPNGEFGYEGSFMYNIKKDTWIGGPYGTKISLNYSIANSIDKQKLNDTTEIGTDGTLGYKSDMFKMGDEKYFEDFNIEINRKFSKTFKAIITYAYITYNKDIIEGHPGAPIIYANIGVLDLSYKLNAKNTIRMELHSLMAEQDDHDWAMCLLEYTIAPKWFFSVADLYNYGNPDSERRFHYYNAALGFTKGTNRIALSYGKQRQGITCVGGVCRQVPASNGILLTVTSSF
jgi:hypothetical protein